MTRVKICRSGYPLRRARAELPRGIYEVTQAANGRFLFINDHLNFSVSGEDVLDHLNARRMVVLDGALLSH
jgi:hypothetical protein